MGRTLANEALRVGRALTPEEIGAATYARLLLPSGYGRKKQKRAIKKAIRTVQAS